MAPGGNTCTGYLRLDKLASRWPGQQRLPEYGGTRREGSLGTFLLWVAVGVGDRIPGKGTTDGE